MKFFSKIVFICNICFILSVILRFVELYNKKQSGHENNVIPLPFVEGTLVVLGVFAIFINLFFCLMCTVRWVRKREVFMPKWLLITNAVILLFQFIYYSI